MKKVILFAFAIMYFLPSNAQKTFDEQFKMYEIRKAEFSGVETYSEKYMSSTATRIEEMTKCLDLVKTEEQYIQLYTEKHMAYMPPIEKENEHFFPPEIIQLNINVVAKLAAYESKLFGHRYYKDAIIFFNKNIPSLSAIHNTKEGRINGVLHFRKKLNEYSVNHLFWILEFSGDLIDADIPDVTTTEKQLAIKKIGESSLKIDFFPDLDPERN